MASNAAIHPPAPVLSFFAQGYKESFRQWWSNCNPKTSETKVLSFIPFLRAAESSPSDVSSTPDPHGNRIWRSTMVALSGKNRVINEFSVERVDEPVKENLVMLHGYGAGLGFFYKNYEPLSRLAGWRLYSLDLPGMGNSSRPDFSIRARDAQGRVTDTENWFTSALEEWREKRELDKFTLVAHSLGGYLAIAYALRYPGRVKKLVLVSPVGIPEDPYAVDPEAPEPRSSTVQNEVMQDQESIVHGDGVNNNKSMSSASKATPPKRPLPGWAVWLWDANMSPFAIIRWLGPLGPRFVSAWSSRRFNHLDDEEYNALHEYSYSIFSQRGSSEYALTYLLAPGAYARSPMIRRIAGVGRQRIPHLSRDSHDVYETGIPIVMMYGDQDWMDVAGAYAAEEKLKEAKVQALLHGTEEQKRNEKGSIRVVIVRDAGHHLYLDNPDEFNEVLLREMKETERE